MFHFCVWVSCNGFYSCMVLGFWVCFFLALFFYPPPPSLGKVNNLIKVIALSGLGAEQLLSAFQGVYEEVSFGVTGLYSDAELFDLLD